MIYLWMPWALCITSSFQAQRSEMPRFCLMKRVKTSSSLCRQLVTCTLRWWMKPAALSMALSMLPMCWRSAMKTWRWLRPNLDLYRCSGIIAWLWLEMHLTGLLCCCDLQDSNGQVAGGGVSVYYSHVLQMLFFSYSQGKSFAATINRSNMDAQRLFTINVKGYATFLTSWYLFGYDVLIIKQILQHQSHLTF